MDRLNPKYKRKLIMNNNFAKRCIYDFDKDDNCKACENCKDHIDINVVIIIDAVRDDGGIDSIAIASSDENADKMIEKLKSTDGFENFEYTKHEQMIDSMLINNKPFVIERGSL